MLVSWGINYQFLEVKACIHVNLAFTSASYGEGDGTPLQYSCLENPMDGGDQ